ncbi:MAG: pyridoxine 5'-phosphate synthase [Nitrospinae bacterium]|nr:pyridoxine 5'-phosphate synthase [Nitrospinota bacterium]
MKKLCVNVDHIATIREARKTNEPDPVHAAVLAELGGADGITIHLREDRRHIQDRDLRLMREIVKTKLNLEMAATGEMAGIALDVKPDQVSLVPEKREEVTTEGGLDVLGQHGYLAGVVKKLQGAGIPVSLFIDPDPRHVKAAKETGAVSIEINTGKYSEAKAERGIVEELEKIKQAAFQAASLGLRVYAGHGLTYKNISSILTVAEVEEFNIGHNIVARASMVGMETAVREMVRVIQSGNRAN